MVVRTKGLYISIIISISRYIQYVYVLLLVYVYDVLYIL